MIVLIPLFITFVAFAVLAMAAPKIHQDRILVCLGVVTVIMLVAAYHYGQSR